MYLDIFSTKCSTIGRLRKKTVQKKSHQESKKSFIVSPNLMMLTKICWHSIGDSEKSLPTMFQTWWFRYLKYFVLSNFLLLIPRAKCAALDCRKEGSNSEKFTSIIAFKTYFVLSTFFSSESNLFLLTCKGQLLLGSLHRRQVAMKSTRILLKKTV